MDKVLAQLTGRASERISGLDVAEMSRRQFLLVSSLTAAGIALSACTPKQVEELNKILDKIANRPIRRDINSLSLDDPTIVAFKDAVAAMKALPSSDRRNWARQADIHNNFCPHRNWLFLPWHRAYLYLFEEICRELSSNEDFALPYWNWSNNPKIPSAFWGGSANPLFNPTRSATASSTASPSMVGPSVIEAILDQTNFLLFASAQLPSGNPQQSSVAMGPLEASPHNHIHPFVGGDMSSFLSPVDPVFWCHHNMVECIWVEWNWKRGNPNTNHTDWTSHKFTEFCDRHGNPVEVVVSETLLYPLFNYRYDDPVLGVP